MIGVPKRRLEPRSVMYYAQAVFEFTFDEINLVAKLCYFLGPRYGACFRYVVKKEKEDYYLSDQKMLWIS